MSAFPALLAATLPVFFMMGIGAAFRWTDWWPESADRPLARLAINVFYPSLIAHHVLGNPVLDSVSILAWSAGLGFTLLILSFGFALLMAKLIGLRAGLGLRTFAVAGGIQNYGFLPIPIIATLYTGEEARRILGVLFLHNLGLEIAIWTVGILLLKGADRGSWKHLINTPLVTIAVAASLTLLGGSSLIPQPLVITLGLIGPASIPVGLFLAGASLVTANAQTRWLGSWRISAGAIGLRFLLLPCLFLGAALALPLSVELKRVLVIQGSMPTGAFVIVLARHYGGHAPIASQIVITTFLVGLIAIPTLLSIGLPLIP